MITFKLKYQLVTYFLKNWALPHSPKANDRTDHRAAGPSSCHYREQTSHRSLRGADSSSAEEVLARSGRPRQTGPTLKGRDATSLFLCLHLLQLSKQEFQVWSQFITEGIVKNVFQKNLRTKHTVDYSDFNLGGIPQDGLPDLLPSKLESQNTAPAPYKAVFRIQSEGGWPSD